MKPESSFFSFTPLKAFFILLVVSILAFAPGISSLPVLDRDEARFAQASKQMMLSQDYVDIRFQDEARHKKPVGIYWAQIFTSKAFDSGEHVEIWPYRVPSFLGAIFAVMFTFLAARAILSTSGAFTAGLIIATSILLMAEARIAKTDAALLFTICMAQAAYIHCLTALRDRRPIANWLIIGFWMAIAGGILLKGPITPMVLALTMLGLAFTTKDWRIFKAIKPLWGLGIVLLICAPWFIAITIKSGGSFFAESVGKDLVAKVGSAQEKHGAPPLTYLALFPVLFWPWAGLFLASIGNIWKSRHAFITQWCFWWSVPTWLLFELIPTKLPHYVLPTFPALAIALAFILHTLEITRWKLWQKLALILPPLIGVGVAVIATFAMLQLESKLDIGSLCTFSFAGILSIFAALQFNKRALKMGIIASALSGIVMSTAILVFFLPNMSSLFLSERINTVVRTKTPCEWPTTGLSGYYEPSVVFLLGTQTQQLKFDETAAFLATQRCGIVVVDTLTNPKTPDIAPAETTFLQDAAKMGLIPHKIGQVQGRNMNGGRERVLSIWSK